MVEGREVRTSASVGIALSMPTHMQAEDLLQDADVAMRRAKALGGSRCEVFDEAMHTRAVNRLKLEAELREAHRASGSFACITSRSCDSKPGRLPGLKHCFAGSIREQGLISPYKFMAAAENTGLLVSTGQWMILEACKQLQSWNEREPIPCGP